MRNGLGEFGLASMRAGVSPFTDGVPGRGRKAGWPGGLAATGYVAKYPSNEWFSWKITTRCAIGVRVAGGAGRARSPAASDAAPRARARTARTRRGPPPLRSIGARPARPGPEAPVEDVAEAVAEQVHGEHRHHDGEAGKRGDPPRLAQVVAPLAQHAPPLGRGRRAAETEEAEGRRGENRRAEAEGGGDDERGEHVGQDVAAHDEPVASAHRARRLHVAQLPG